MRIIGTFVVTFLLTGFVSSSVYACDFDGDGIDDPAAISVQEDETWNWTANLSTGGTKTETGFGDATTLSQAAGYYFNNTMAEFGIIEADYDWMLPNGDRNPAFGATGVTFGPGHDFDGDGVSDAVKFEHRCNRLTRRCYKNKARANMTINLTDGTNAFTSVGFTKTHLFGSALTPMLIADGDGDGISETCTTKPLRRNRRLFKAICMQYGAGENDPSSIVHRRRVTRVFNNLLALKVDGQADGFVSYKTRNRKGDTRFWVYPASGPRIIVVIDQVGEVLVGDWLGIGSQQVGVVADGNIYYRDPFSETEGIIAIPEGNPVDCYNHLEGPGESTLLTSKNVCQVLDC